MTPQAAAPGPSLFDLVPMGKTSDEEIAVGTLLAMCPHPALDDGPALELSAMVDAGDGEGPRRMRCFICRACVDQRGEVDGAAMALSRVVRVAKAICVTVVSLGVRDVVTIRVMADPSAANLSALARMCLHGVVASRVARAMRETGRVPSVDEIETITRQTREEQRPYWGTILG